MLNGELGLSRSPDPAVKDAAIWTIGGSRIVGNGVFTATVAANATRTPTDPLLMFDRALLPAVIVAANEYEPWGSWRAVWVGTFHTVGGVLSAEATRALSDTVGLTVGADLPHGATLSPATAFTGGKRVAPPSAGPGDPLCPGVPVVLQSAAKIRLPQGDIVRRVLIGMAVTCLWASAAQAQTCYGALGTPLTVGADVGFSANTQAVTAGVAKDSGNMYLRGAVALASVSGTGTAKGFVGLVGYNLKVSHSTRFSVCPTVTVMKLWGIEPGDGSSVSPLALSFGGSVGFNATTFNTTQVVPTFGLFVNRLTEHFGGTDSSSGRQPPCSPQASGRRAAARGRVHLPR